MSEAPWLCGTDEVSDTLQELMRPKPEEVELKVLDKQLNSALDRVRHALEQEGHKKRTAAVTAQFPSDVSGAATFDLREFGTDMVQEVSKPGRHLVLSFVAEEWTGVDMENGSMCYVFNDVVICSKKRPTSLSSTGDQELTVLAELPVSSCEKATRIPGTRKHAIAGRCGCTEH